MSVRYLTYCEIADAVGDDSPIEITQEELIKISRQAGGLKFVRRAGRRSEALWRCDDFCSWLSRRLRHAPEIAEQIISRLYRRTPRR